MKGIILAGGHGTRLEPLTKITNKHLIAVYDRPMIDYPIGTLVEMGIRDILIVSGREHAGSFVEYLGSGKDRDLNFTYKVQEKAGGIAQALGLAEKFANKRRIAVILGDNYFEYPVSPPDDDICGLVLKQVPDPERFGVYDKGRIIEKPKSSESNLAVTGLYFYPNDVFKIIKTLKPSARGELEITDINNAYCEQGRVCTTQYDGFWCDMGTPTSLARTIKHIFNG